MTAAPVMSITDELVAELEKEAWLCDSDTSIFMEPAVVAALLAERAELVKDRERLDWLVKEEALVVELKQAQRFHVAWPSIGENQILCFISPREAIDAARADNP